ncbi:DUF6161 domain-containing protein [Pseudomonas tumuqii]|uniref:DUF6161 domain-containing protein n=1 Tax=Pseudomonas tumuqii TaxID=2715755 RepID=UPI0015544383|nr:DUF6161 domain-containing protein [Pseudomonas tumuqii]
MTAQFKFSLTDLKGIRKNFESIETFLDFAKCERDFWNGEAKHKLQELGVNVRSNVLSNALGAGNIFHSLISTVESWLPIPEEMEEREFNSKLQTLQREASNLNSRWIRSDYPFIMPWLESYKISDQTGDGFFEAVTKDQSSNANNYSYLKGYILAYEYLFQNENNLTKRRNAEEKTFASLQNQLSTKKDELIDEISVFQADIRKWAQETRDNFSEWHEAQKKVDVESTANRSDEFDAQMSNWKSKISSLEQTFREKLRFDGPATYWKKQAGKYRHQGIVWTLALVAIVALALIYFREFFLLWADGQRLKLNLATLEGAVIFAAILSSFIFLSRVFSRLAFSSFHLQRDAEEREQLTHLYLALGHETEIDSESRQIVLQALFSRSETGLLSNESGPTMPGLHEAVSAAVRKG